MKTEKLFSKVVFFFMAVFLFAATLSANEPVVMLNAQPVGDQLTDYEITLTVNHEGKGRSHYLESVVLLLNEVPIKVWQYSKKESPKDFPLIFKEKIKISPSGPSMVVAKATCTSDGESDRASLQIIPGKSY
ncbi:MAG TPA: hypothetical protein VJ624_01875 [Thermodesulfobacteriota bacterium]|nr:hypothetical protein [Thermodesulfobacteriota bacterium]